MKSIIKEIIIIALLAVAIVLILGVIFYNYIPINVVVPSDVEPYETSSLVKEEIAENIAEFTKLDDVPFEITNSDLTLYRRADSYDPGKANPFTAYSANTVAVDLEGTGSGNTVTSGKTSNSGTGSTQTFYEDTKLK